jgi:ribosome-associated protein
MTAAPDSLSLARRIAALAEERRATDLVLLDVRGLVDYTDFFLLATGASSRQNQSIGEHVVKTLKGEKRFAISKAGLDTGRWICLDLGDVVFHVFDAETRARYDLELLWADAPRVPTKEEAPAPSKPARRRRVAKKGAVEDADAENAPDSERPADRDEPSPPEPKKKKAPAKRKPKPKAT